MTERVDWLPDGTPRSARFDDIYRPATGGLDQSNHVFLHGCGLPGAWAGHAQWRIFETGFGLGLNFLAAWRAWKDDPQRPRILHFVSVEAWPVSAEDIVRNAAGHAELAPLAGELARRWWGLTPGAHRLSFDGGAVVLTLHIRDAPEMLRSEPFTADSVFLDGFDPRVNPQMWDAPLLKALARHCRRGTRLATWTAAGEVRRTLEGCGFEVHKAEGLAPKRHCTHAVFEPRWNPKNAPAERAAGEVMVIGSGLAGSAVARSFARRGWRVLVLDAGDVPAAGASALPVGLLAPHTSPDDNLLSRLSRAGVRMTLDACAGLLTSGTQWLRSGVLQMRLDGHKAYPQSGGYADWQRDAGSGDAIWHEQAAWVRPASLARALLDHESIEWRGDCQVSGLERDEDEWMVSGSDGVFARAPWVVVASAWGSRALLGDRITLNVVRGQIAWALQDPSAQVPRTPVNGNGHFIPSVHEGDDLAWYCGSTYGRGDDDASIRDEDVRANVDRLATLLPDFASGIDLAQVRSWAGVRCTSNDRRPIVGELEPGLLTSTAMGSRGLTFCILAAELLAARLHNEPLPVDSRLARAIEPRQP